MLEPCKWCTTPATQRVEWETERYDRGALVWAIAFVLACARHASEWAEEIQAAGHRVFAVYRFPEG